MNLREKFLNKIENENFHSLTSDEVYANGGGEGQAWNAAGGVAAAAPSPAFIVTLTNGFSTAVSDVVFLNAFASVGADNSGVTAGVTPTFGISGLTYAGFLKYLQGGNASRIALIRTSSSSSTNLEASWTIETKNYQGQFFGVTITPEINLMQNITTGVDTAVDFFLTGGTKITVSSLAASSSLTFKFYPFQVTSMIANVETGKQFSNPNLSGTVAITNKQAIKV